MEFIFNEEDIFDLSTIDMEGFEMVVDHEKSFVIISSGSNYFEMDSDIFEKKASGFTYHNDEGDYLIFSDEQCSILSSLIGRSENA